MKFGKFVLAAISAASIGTAAAANPIDLQKLSNYFQRMTSLESRFTQINADGTIDTGTLIIDRPGKMRFDYDAPNDALVLASAGSLAIFDNRSNAGPEQYPLSKTPLNLILKRTVNLADARYVTRSETSRGITSITIHDPTRPEIGHMKLSFTDNPVQLRSWVLVNEAREETSIVLGESVSGKTYSSSLFSIIAESNKRTGNR